MSVFSSYKSANVDGLTRALAEPLSRYVFSERFDLVPQANADIGVDANPNLELSGTNAVSLVAATHSTGGGVKLLTAGADNDQAILFPHQDASQSPLNVVDFATDDEVGFVCRVTTDASVAAVLVQIGLALTAAVDETTDADQVKFTYDTDTSGEATWQANWSIGGTDTQVDTGVAVSASTSYNLGIGIDVNRVANFYINDKKVAASGALTTAVDLKPMVAVQALTGAAKTLHLRYVAIGKEYNN